MGRAELTTSVIDVNKHLKEITASSKNIGGIVCFIGVIRSVNDNKRVVKLSYDYYPELADSQLKRLREEAIKNFRLIDAIIIHRVGDVPIGEVSLLVITAGEHRDEPFKAARWLVDKIKNEVAIWKKEVYEDGSRWVYETITGDLHE
ncbi:MAG: molybdenum cofactor biosynthesis protein MoaE [Thermoprotei archaeon]